MERGTAASFLATLFGLLSCFRAAYCEVSWFVHLSDIHTSRYFDPARRPDLESLARNVLSRVEPALIVSTGDQVDSKTQFLRAKQQEEEWISYGELHAYVRNATGLTGAEFLDVRGNHDTFDVPIRTGDTDYFDAHACSSASWGKNSRVTVTPLVSKLSTRDESVSECPTGVLVGIDFSPEPGLRGPTNFLGWAEESLVSEIAGTLSQLSRENQAMGCSPTLIAYGHYPLGLIAYVERSRWPWGVEDGSLARVEQVLLEHGVSAFLCGHLHDKFGLRLHKIWASQTSAMAELETADWKITRRFRIVSVDQGAVSFADLKYVPQPTGAGYAILAVEDGMDVENYIVVVTSPPSAYYAPLGVKPTTPVSPQKIRALVFGVGSTGGKVDVFVEWSCRGTWKRGRLRMENSKAGVQPLFEAPWEPAVMCGGEETKAEIQVVVFLDGRLDSTSEFRLVDTSGAREPLEYPHTFIERFTLSTKWPDFVSRVFICFWVLHVFGMLLLPKILAMKGYFIPPGYIRYGSGDNGKWDCGFVGQDSPEIALGVVKHGWSRRLLGVLISPLRMFCWVSHADAFWKFQLLYFLYIFVGPWAVIRPMEDQPLGLLFRFGVISPDPVTGVHTFLNIADTLLVTLMHYFTVVLPSTLWMVWVISFWQSKAGALNSSWRCLSLPQILFGAVICLQHVWMIQRLGVWYGAWAVLVSPGVTWYGPMCLLGMWSVRKDLKKFRTD